jgi:hypothetical protein
MSSACPAHVTHFEGLRVLLRSFDEFWMSFGGLALVRGGLAGESKASEAQFMLETKL